MKKISRNLIYVAAFVIVATLCWVWTLPAPASPATDVSSGNSWVTVMNEVLVTTSSMNSSATGAIQATGGIYMTGITQKTAVALNMTSPTATFSVVGRSVVTLTADANLTGVVPTGGVAGQEVTIISGAGSNTMRFDDGASMNLGGNITLTEAQFDVLTLRSIDGTNWVRLSNADN